MRDNNIISILDVLLTETTLVAKANSDSVRIWDHHTAIQNMLISWGLPRNTTISLTAILTCFKYVRIKIFTGLIFQQQPFTVLHVYFFTYLLHRIIALVCKLSLHGVQIDIARTKIRLKFSVSDCPW